ncbi:MAG: acetamidase/formamidase family protein [Candidatus Rokubacteria bacterium]|nr:acetamidase/formamidase family protein [Candidatus Rokubacteria bacterium]
MKSVEIDRSKRLKDEPHTGHNRWHPDVTPILEVGSGEEVVLQTRDAADGQIPFGASVETAARAARGAVHPLTGPVYVKGAGPGDLLEIEYLDIIPEPTGWTRIIPGIGFLRNVFAEPYLVHWRIKDGWATSDSLPKVRIPAGCFMGTAGLAPSRAQLEEWTRREADLLARGGAVLPPDPTDAVPVQGPVATEGLRTIPPRENCGNADIKQLTAGSKLFIPVAVPGGLYSGGDGHFAQGDSECCITAIEIGATVAIRFRVHQGEAGKRRIRWPRFARTDYFVSPQWAAPKRFVATVGMPIRDDGVNEGEDLTLAARNALLNMIALLQERGWTREQAYILCSVAVDLKVSNVVNTPNFGVSAFLPEDVFEGEQPSFDWSTTRVVVGSSPSARANLRRYRR